MARSKVHRRDFLKTAAAGAAALSLTAASAKRVVGANDRIGVAFIGTDGRSHLENGLRANHQWRYWPRSPGANELLSQFRRRAVALLSSHSGHDAADR